MADKNKIEKARKMTEQLSDSDILSRKEAAAYSYINIYELDHNVLYEYQGFQVGERTNRLRKEAEQKIESAKHIVSTLEKFNAT